MPRICPACGAPIDDGARFQECSTCHRNYHLEHRCPAHPHATMLVISPRQTGRRPPAEAGGPVATTIRRIPAPLQSAARGYRAPIAASAAVVLVLVAVIYGFIGDFGIPLIGSDPDQPSISTRAPRGADGTRSPRAAGDEADGSEPTEAESAAREASDAKATRDARLDLAEIKFGPDSDRLTAEARPTGSTTSAAGVRLRDPMVEVRLYTPSDEGSEWDYGIAFRQTGANEEYRLIVTSGKEWFCDLIDGDPDKPVSRQEGTLTGVDTQAGEHNDLQLLVIGKTGLFFINGHFVATLDLAEKLDRGDVAVGSAFLPEHQAAGQETRYENFQVSARSARSEIESDGS